MTINHYQFKEKKVTYKSIRGFLVILLIAQAINLVMFKGLDISQKKLGDYLYQTMTEPFLEQTPSVALTSNR